MFLKKCNQCGKENAGQAMSCVSCGYLFDKNAHSKKGNTNDTDRLKFKDALNQIIFLKYSEILSAKSDEKKYLTYFEAQSVTICVRNIFKNALGFIPPQIEMACNLSDAILAPSRKEKNALIKKAYGLTGGLSGITMIITGIGTALGWGAGLITSVSAFFVGSSLLGPVGWIAGGIAIAVIAGYFSLTSDNEKDTERFINALKMSSSNAVDSIWDEYGHRLSYFLVNGKPLA
ncbi:MAG: hypothetical protein QX197_01140 [Methylococcaceae bacterium]